MTAVTSPFGSGLQHACIQRIVTEHPQCAGTVPGPRMNQTDEVPIFPELPGPGGDHEQSKVNSEGAKGWRGHGTGNRTKSGRAGSREGLLPSSPVGGVQA